MSISDNPIPPGAQPPANPEEEIVPPDPEVYPEEDDDEDPEDEDPEDEAS